MKRIRECTYNARLDMQTLVWTRGAEFPLAMLGGRLKCPACGSREVALLYEVPHEPVRAGNPFVR